MGWQETVSVPGGMEELIWGRGNGRERGRWWDGEMRSGCKRKRRKRRRVGREREERGRERLSKRNISPFSEKLWRRGAKAAGREAEWRKWDDTNSPNSCMRREREKQSDILLRRFGPEQRRRVVFCCNMDPKATGKSYLLKLSTEYVWIAVLTL